MKKTIAILFICLAAIASASCTNNTDTDTQGRVGTTGTRATVPARRTTTVRRRASTRTTAPTRNTLPGRTATPTMPRVNTPSPSRIDSTNPNTRTTIDNNTVDRNVTTPATSRGLNENVGNSSATGIDGIVKANDNRTDRTLRTDRIKTAASVEPFILKNKNWQNCNLEDAKTCLGGNAPTLNNIPAGYNLNDIKKSVSATTRSGNPSPNAVCLNYTKDGAEPISLIVEKNQGVPADKITSNKVNIMGVLGYETNTDGHKELTWCKNNTLYSLIAPDSMDNNEFIKCARSIKPV